MRSIATTVCGFGIALSPPPYVARRRKISRPETNWRIASPTCSKNSTLSSGFASSSRSAPWPLPQSASYCLNGLSSSIPPPAFGHGVEVTVTNGRRTIVVVASYHPSRQNTNTGKLTAPMFDAIFSRANQILAQDANASLARAARGPESVHPSLRRGRLGSLEKR